MVKCYRNVGCKNLSLPDWKLPRGRDLDYLYNIMPIVPATVPGLQQSLNI